ncbi:MAG: hypothetical protein WCL16_00655 [bacterium]
MKAWVRQLSMLPAALALTLAIPAGAAFDFVATNAYVVPVGQTLQAELWCYAGGATIAGTAQDDLFLIADASATSGKSDAGLWHRLLSSGATNAQPEAALPTITVSGTAARDLWALAPAIAIPGHVAGSARLAGLRTIELAGRIGRTLMAYGETVRLAPGSQVAGDVLLLGQTILMEGHVVGDSRLLGATVTLAGEFGGTVRVTAPKLNVLPGMHIGGDLEYTATDELVLPQGAQVGGTLRRIQAPINAARTTDLDWGVVVSTLGFFMAALLTGLAFVALFPATTAVAHQNLEQSPWRCLLAGFVAVALLPMIILLLSMTIVGLPLAALLGCGYAIVLYTGKILTALWLGRRLLRSRPAWQGNAIALLAIGLLVIYALLALPFPIDIALWFAFTCLGAGGLVLAILDRRIPVLAVSKSNGVPPSSTENKTE